MLLDARKLLRPGAEPEEGRAELDLSGRDYYGYTVPGPVRAVWHAAPLHGQVRLNLAVDAEIAAECARCLSPATQALHVEQEYLFTQEDMAEEVPLLPFLPDGTLDFDELVYGEIVMEAPGAIVCDEDCPGLCQRCGKPAVQCQCPPEDETDPRLAVLKQLLTDDEADD